MTVILQNRLPEAPLPTERMPGIMPVPPAEWLLVDDAYAAQMAERTRLIARHPDRVHRLTPQAMPAAQELLRHVLDQLRDRTDFKVCATDVTRPDGVRVPLDSDAPLLTLGHLVQQDFCLLQQQGDVHLLTGAILCFPASWTLAEKIGRPLIAIHRPVPAYDGDVARRVQRLFDAIRPGQVLGRANALVYDDPTLFQPCLEDAPRRPAQTGGYLRSERQCLIRLPESGAVVFSIHTSVIRRDIEKDAQ